MNKDHSLNIEQSWKLWVECLEGNDTNSIFNQVRRLLSNYAYFELILAGRRSIIKNILEQTELYARLNNFFDYIYFDSQASRIRRLIEPEKLKNQDFKKKSKLIGEKGVFSLVPLLEDMRLCRIKLTREKYFDLRGLSYDYDEIKKQALEYQAAMEDEERFIVLPPELDWMPSAKAHELFDRLSDVNVRNPDDLIKDEVFLGLIKKLNSFWRLINHVNKYIAHSATPESRIEENSQIPLAKWKDIGDACKVIYEIANFLALFLSATDYIGLAMIPPSIFNDDIQQIIIVDDIQVLKIEWEKYRAETESWRINCCDNVFSYIN